MKKKKTKFKVLNKIHINYKDWNRVCKMAKANGIKTFAELEMYCRIWEIESGLHLICVLGNDYIEILQEKFKEEVNSIGTND